MEAEYEHECSRAELLGLPKPTREQFENSRAITSQVHHGENYDIEHREEETEELTREKAESQSERKEGFRRMASGLDELNNILLNTQKKLNRIKNVFGNLTGLVRSQSEQERQERDEGSSNFIPQGDTTENEKNGNEGKRNTGHYSVESEKSDVDKLDLLINKAERAEMSLASQNKQMKKFLN